MAMSIYSLTLPTLTLILNIAQLGIPTTISKLIAKKKYSTFKIMQVSVISILTIDLIIGVIYLFFVPSIANIYLKNSNTILTLYGMVLLLPLVSLTSIIKGYFIGIDQVDKTSKCQISEELVRLLFIIIFVDLIDKENISLLSLFAMFSSIVGEIASLIHLSINLNLKKKKIPTRIQKFNEQNKTIFKVIMKYSLLSTSTRLIGSLIYFLEPIIFTYLMIKNGIEKEVFTLQYGIVTSYVFPLILLPSFFSNCISIYMLPKLSSSIENKNYEKTKKSFFILTIASFFSGFLVVLFIFLFPELCTKLIYGKVIGIDYIKKYALLLSVFFLQTPIHMILIAFDKEKSLLIESIICNAIRIAGFFLFIPKYNTDGMIISIIISIYASLLIHLVTLFNCFITLKNKSKILVDV